MRILLALVALCRWRDLLAQELTTVTTQRSNTVKENLNIADKRLQFVNIIRDDLRRNNDDYALLERQNRLVYPAPPANHLHLAAQPPYRKRMLPPGPRPQPLPQYYGDTRTGKGDMNQSFQDENAFRSYTHSKHYKKERVNKLKRLLNKDKVQMREAEQNEEDTTINTSPPPPPRPSPPPRPPPPPPSPPPARITPPPTPEPRSRFTPHRRDHESPPPEDTDWEIRGLRYRKERESQSPSPDQLDMAAARNPEITRIRVKGRLCQRSLMNLEGPTYDKLGKEVVPAFKPRKVRGRNFHQTRAPELVLPRCCNCCKKSVLGCQ